MTANERAFSSKWSVPNGKKTGALYRTTKPGGMCSLWGERMEVLDADEIKQALADRKAAGIKGRDSVKQIFDQDGVGSCAAEATTQGCQSQRVRQNMPYVQLSPWFLYYHSSGGVDRGSTLDENLALARDIGIASMAVWPRSKGWRTKPSAAAYEDALNHRIWEIYDLTSKAEIQTALVRDFLVQFGHDSHSELMVDLLDLDNVDVANSWDVSWGDNGFHTFPLSRVNFAYGVFGIRAAQ